MKSIVISIGGSVILSEDIDNSYFEDIAICLKELCKKFKIYLIVGGGKTARTYIDLGRKLGFDEETLDEIGISLTRVNAKILATVLDISNKSIPLSTDEAINIDEPIVVMGGTSPGHSTDLVGAELSEKVNACKFIVATNVNGVFDKDPNKYNDAKQLKEVSIKQLVSEHGTNWGSAGKNVVIDGPALELINKAGIPTFVLNGKRLDELKKAISDQSFDGTVIKV